MVDGKNPHGCFASEKQLGGTAQRRGSHDSRGAPTQASDTRPLTDPDHERSVQTRYLLVSVPVRVYE